MDGGAIHGKILSARQAINRGNVEAARKIVDEAFASAPANLDLLEIKALVETQSGDHAGAEETLRSAMRIAPERRWPYGDLARLLLKLDRKSEAEAVARQALEADPANPDAHAMLALLLSEREQWFEAASHYDRAIALAGRHPQLLTGLGHALMRLGRLNDALDLLRSAASLDPTSLEPAVYLAEAEERLGRFGEAMIELDRAERIAVARGTDVKLQRSVLLGRMGRNEEALELLESSEDLSGAALLQRGRLRDKAGRHEGAWADWAAAKAQLAAKRKHHYPASEVEAEVTAMMRSSDEKRLQSIVRPGPQQGVPQPILIIGFPRSGTTLIEQILASHSAIRAGGELPFGPELRDLAASKRSEGSFGDRLANISGAELLALRDHYLARAQSFGLFEGSATYFTDKMPSNDLWLPLLRLAFPHSPVVLVRRHPLDVLTSVISHDMTHGFHCAYRLEDAAQHLALMDRALDHYRSAGLGPTHELRYEALVADQQGETARLMEAVGLPLEPAQLRFHERSSVAPTPSYAQVQEPLNDRSIGRWRHYSSQLEIVRPLVADAMARGNYAP